MFFIVSLKSEFDRKSKWEKLKKKLIAHLIEAYQYGMKPCGIGSWALVLV